MVQPADAAKEISRLSREMERLYHELSLKTGLSDSAFLIFTPSVSWVTAAFKRRLQTNTV